MQTVLSSVQVLYVWEVPNLKHKDCQELRTMTQTLLIEKEEYDLNGSTHLQIIREPYCHIYSIEILIKGDKKDLETQLSVDGDPLTTLSQIFLSIPDNNKVRQYKLIYTRP